ncbi:MAG: hypothetical protein G01um10143_750 [Parcubacteria group bacterium Gr01-1014_3]|nr:MAG: hypothetical protein G01um10143_750 [Parcubacteria group bacterium Gr01-1014_3]
MGYWSPDQDFLEFIATDAKGELGIQMGGGSVLDEIKRGTALGKEMYFRLWNNKSVQKRYQKWKAKHKK